MCPIPNLQTCVCIDVCLRWGRRRHVSCTLALQVGPCIITHVPTFSSCTILSSPPLPSPATTEEGKRYSLSWG